MNDDVEEIPGGWCSRVSSTRNIEAMGKVVSKIRFGAKLFRPVGDADWTFLRLPQDASDQLPSRSMVSVEGTINGFPFQTTLHPDGQGGHWLKVKPELSERAEIHPGDTFHLEISPMTVEPEPEVPDDLRETLAAHPEANAVWLDITPLARRDWIQWMTSGKKAETRTLRLGKMMDMLAKGKRRICCFDRSGMYDKSLSCPIPAIDS